MSGAGEDAAAAAAPKRRARSTAAPSAPRAKRQAAPRAKRQALPKDASKPKAKRQARAEDPNKPKAKRQARVVDRDPNMPKRPPTAYFVFAKENFAAIAAEIGTKRPKEVSAVMAKRWKALPANQKEEIAKKPQDAMEEYKKQLAAYKKTGAYEEHRVAAKRKKEEAAAAAAAAPALGPGAEVDLSVASAMTRASDEELLAEISRRFARSVRPRPAGDDHETTPLSAALGGVTETSEAANDAEVVKTQGYLHWYDNKGKAKLEKKIGTASSKEMQEAARKMWSEFSDERKQKWEDAAASS